jgi:hypothetical protein
MSPENPTNRLRDDDDDAEHDAVATSDDSASDALHAQPKASRSNAAPTGEGVLIPPAPAKPVTPPMPARYPEA